MIDKNKATLVVDDIQPARETAINIFKALGFKKFYQADNGDEAREKLKAHPDIGLIVSDWKMPRQDGLELLRYIRKTKDYKNLPFIMVTSKSEAEDVALAADFEVTAYLVKPMTIQSLIEKLRSLDEGAPEEIVQDTILKVRELIEEERFDKGENMLLETMKRIPEFTARLSYELAVLHTAQGNLEEAEQAVKQALKEKPLMARAWRLHSVIHIAKGEVEEAEFCMEKAVSISPDNADYLVDLGKSQLHQEKTLEAKTSFQKAININPKDEEIKENIWNSYVELDKIPEAEKEFGQTIMDGLSVQILNQTAVSLRKQGKMEQAINFYRLALAKSPENPKILYNLAVAFLSIDKKDMAEKYARKAVESDPNFVEAQDFLANLDGDDLFF